VFLSETIRSTIHAVLIFAVGLFCCLGSSYTYEVKHDHAHFDEHCNSYDLVCDYSSDHGHSHDDDDDHEKSDGDDNHSHDPNDRSHSHTHLVSIDLPAACLAKVPSTQFAHMAKYSFSPHVSDTAPDGPCYDLIKPPQLG
jgi:hypothetical protein